MLQTEWGLRAMLRIASDESVFPHSHVECSGAGFVDRCRAVLFGQLENAEDAAHADFSLLTFQLSRLCAVCYDEIKDGVVWMGETRMQEATTN